MTTEGFAAVTCLHIAVVTDDFPEGPGSVAASFNHLVHLVFKQLVSMQSNMQSSGEFFIVLQKNKYFLKKEKVNTRSIGHIGCFEKKNKKNQINKQPLIILSLSLLRYHIVSKTVLKRGINQGVSQQINLHTDATLRG